jgi:hypothetical protein
MFYVWGDIFGREAERIAAGRLAFGSAATAGPAFRAARSSIAVRR